MQVEGGLDRKVNQQGKVWRPPTDVYETSGAIVVRVEIAGMDEGDFDIELTRRELTVSGRRTDHTGRTKLAYQQMEVLYGDFRTEVYLPWAVNTSAVEATYEKGFLTIVLPRADVLRVPISGTSD